MSSLRPWLHAVLGLALLVQGIAYASAPHAVASHDATAAEESAASDEMPCHGTPETAAIDETPDCACCDTGCVDMSGCAFGQLAVQPAMQFHLVPVHSAAIAAPEQPVASVSLPSLLRPPISLHA